MRTFYLPLLHSFLFGSASCKNHSKNNNLQNNQNQQNNDINYIESMDNLVGMVASYSPYPSNWKESKQTGYLMEGHNNIRVSGANFTNFQFTNNQELLWMWKQQVIQNVPVQHDAQTYVLDWKDNNGMSYLTTFVILFFLYYWVQQIPTH